MLKIIAQHEQCTTEEIIKSLQAQHMLAEEGTYTWQGLFSHTVTMSLNDVTAGREFPDLYSQRFQQCNGNCSQCRSFKDSSHHVRVRMIETVSQRGGGGDVGVESYFNLALLGASSKQWSKLLVAGRHWA